MQNVTERREEKNYYNQQQFLAQGNIESGAKSMPTRVFSCASAEDEEKDERTRRD